MAGETGPMGSTELNPGVAVPVIHTYLGLSNCPRHHLSSRVLCSFVAKLEQRAHRFDFYPAIRLVVASVR